MPSGFPPAGFAPIRIDRRSASRSHRCRGEFCRTLRIKLAKEWGLGKNENPNQRAFVIEELTDLAEEAVLAEFDRISERGGVLGAMETGYQRGKIQDEPIFYERKKHDGSLLIIGVNTFLNPSPLGQITHALWREAHMNRR